MDRTAVVSSQIKSVGYSEKERVLEVEFARGGVYRYTGVPPEEHKKLMGAPSVGIHFTDHIKTRYPFEKLTTSA